MPSLPHPMHAIHLACCALVALSATGCSLVYDFDSECSTAEDCRRFEADEVFYTCEANNCVQDTSIMCRANEDCADGGTCVAGMCEGVMTDMPPDTDDGMMPGEDMPPDLPPQPDMKPSRACTATSECIDRFGETYICNPDDTCIDALGDFDDCKQVYYSPTANPDNVVYIASLLPLVDPFGPIIGEPLANAVQLAVDEINDDGGLAGGRKIAWISCDTRGTASVAQRAATHLANNVGVPAVIGPLFSEAFIATASNVTNQADIFAIAPAATSPSIAQNRAGKDLVWSTIVSDEFQAEGIVQRVGNYGATNILILYKDDKYGDDLQQLVNAGLAQNASLNVETRQYPNPADLGEVTNPEIQTQYADIIGQTVDTTSMDGFVPDVVVILGTSEGALAAGAYLTVANPQLVTPPRFIVSHGVVPSLEDIAAQLVAQGIPSLTQRFEGVAPDILDPTSPAYIAYRQQYSQTFNDLQPSLASTTTFDAVMTVALAAATLDADAEITGPKIADGIASLVDKEDGTPLTFYETPSFVSTGVNTLQSGGTLDISGVSGELDFDLDTGRIYSPLIGWELVQNPDTQNYLIQPVRRMTFPNAPATTGASWEALMMPAQ